VSTIVNLLAWPAPEAAAVMAPPPPRRRPRRAYARPGRLFLLEHELRDAWDGHVDVDRDVAALARLGYRNLRFAGVDRAEARHRTVQQVIDSGRCR
jgi:hypothetical protein